MKAVLTFDLKAETAEEAQKILGGICNELGRKNLIGDYRYQIETSGGPVTEKCVLSEGRVIA